MFALVRRSDPAGEVGSGRADPRRILAIELPRPHPGVRARLRDRFLARAPRIAGLLATLLGLLALLDAIGPGRLKALSSAVFPPVPTRALATASLVLAGLLLLRIAAGLRRRKRVEWRLAVLASTALLVSGLVRGDQRPVEAALTSALLAVLLLARRRFTARADPHSRWFAARVAAQFLLAGLGAGLVLLYMPGHLVGNPSLVARTSEVLCSLVGVGGSLHLQDELYADAFYATMLAIGLAGIATTVLLLIRPAAPRAELTAGDEARMRELLLREGRRDSLGYFALRRDKSVVWSATGKAAIAYRVVAGVALASGDPLGDPEAWPGAINAFRALVDEYGWTPAVMGCSELGARVYKREYGLTALALGDEAVLSVADFALEGRGMRTVRQACTRVTRAGYTASVRRVRDVDSAELAELRTAADAWLGDAVERGYSMALSRLGDPADPDCVIVTARREGRLYGLLHFVPWGRTGLSLDLMRRDRTSDNGLNEFMIVATVRACPRLAVERLSLNFAVFRDALERGGRLGAGPVSRGWRRLLLLASRWWQIESLYRFNGKFHPEWTPRFISYPAARDLFRIGLAALEAESFLVRPRVLRKLFDRV